MNRWILTLAALMIVFAFGVSAEANLVTNGSFEPGNYVPEYSWGMRLSPGDTNITGWTVSVATVDWVVGTYWQAEDGNMSVDLSGASGQGELSQTISTVAGLKYTLDFYLSGNPDNYNDPAIDNVKVLLESTGGPVTSYSFTVTGTQTHSNMDWTLETATFTATGASTTLSFQSQNDSGYGPVLDNVSFALSSSSETSFIPEPATLVVWSLLGGAGLLGLRGARRRGSRTGWSEENRVAIQRIIEQGCSKR